MTAVTLTPAQIGAIVVITTVPDENLAVKISESLLQQHIAACVHILPAGQSRYRWNSTIETAAEFTLIIKTQAARFAEVEAAVTRLHPYKVPEILALPVVNGSQAYLKWITDETT
jgi:periplasmic divalent cation tolerance protein